MAPSQYVELFLEFADDDSRLRRRIDSGMNLLLGLAGVDTRDEYFRYSLIGRGMAYDTDKLDPVGRGAGSHANRIGGRPDNPPFRNPPQPFGLGHCRVPRLRSREAGAPWRLGGLGYPR